MCCSFSPSRAKEDERDLHALYLQCCRFITRPEKVGVFVYMLTEGDCRV